MSVKVISWNIAGRKAPWHCLGAMDADIALLQEAAAPPQSVVKDIEDDPTPWCTAELLGLKRRTAIVKLTDRVKVDWIATNLLADAKCGDLAVSRLGTLTAAHVTAPGVEPLVVVSMYSQWERPHASTCSKWIVSDASAHRLVSDLSAFIGRQTGHRIVAAGDLNILYGYGDYGNKYWAGRYATVFDRMEALGLPFVGPQYPNGRQADPWPDELPCESKNVPTFHSAKQTPASATRQLDFVFASRGLADKVTARALNKPEEWGPSDHCRLEIEVS